MPEGAPARFLPAPLDALRKSSSEDIVGTLLPRDFFVRFGTGTGTGTEGVGRSLRREVAVAEDEEAVDSVVVLVVIAPPPVDEDPERQEPEAAEEVGEA